MQALRDGVGLLAETQQNKTELTGLSQTERQQPAVAGTQTKNLSKHKEHGGFDGNDTQRQRHNQGKVRKQHRKVDPRTHGNKEQTEQQAFEGFDVRFQLVAEFAVREDDSGEKRAERGRKLNQCHQ